MIQAPSEKLNRSPNHRGYFAEWNFVMAVHSEWVPARTLWPGSLMTMRRKKTKNYRQASPLEPGKLQPEQPWPARLLRDYFHQDNPDKQRQPPKKPRLLPDPPHTPDTQQRHSAGSPLLREDSRVLSANSSTSQQL
jgi:hypothetical protein